MTRASEVKGGVKVSWTVRVGVGVGMTVGRGQGPRACVQALLSAAWGPGRSARWDRWVWSEEAKSPIHSGGHVTVT